MIDHLVKKILNIFEHNFLETKVMFLNCHFCPISIPKAKDMSQKLQILTCKKLESAMLTFLPF